MGRCAHIETANSVAAAFWREMSAIPKSIIEAVWHDNRIGTEGEIPSFEFWSRKPDAISSHQQSKYRCGKAREPGYLGMIRRNRY